MQVVSQASIACYDSGLSFAPYVFFFFLTGPLIWSLFHSRALYARLGIIELCVSHYFRGTTATHRIALRLYCTTKLLYYAAPSYTISII